ncbi:glycosyltransferase [Pseudodesulfovibrio cashew]|uniref:Glycosyltransferase n=1 Tax=Pseudodesulfovibrio cashew TaxID=2678688 RepID=A0A6I6JFI6_9BACT|nr:glycosyltransferase [Pseudodesulfovibrio cashew]QGY39172.1 glycosyltransferase [Pseudodesulfovibrio cashew]
MTIVHLRDSNFVGGPERQILEHFQRMPPESYDMVLVCYEEDGSPNDLRIQAERRGFRCLTLPTRSPFSWRNIKEIVAMLREADADILVTHGHKGNIFGRIACWMVSIPTIAVSRGWTMESFKIRVFEFLDKIFLHFADHVVAVSEGQRRKILSFGVSPGKISVIHNSIDVCNWGQGDGADIRSRLGVPEGAVLVVSAGRLSPEKDQRTLILAAEWLAVERDDVYFAVFGEGVLRDELERAVQEAGLEGRFFLPGFCQDMVSVMRAVDIFCLPSLTEGLPNVILEAFACSKPVVATRVGGTPELVQDGKNGLLVEPEDAASLSKALGRLCSDSELRRSMGEVGKKMVESSFTYAQQSEMYKKLYSAIVGVER